MAGRERKDVVGRVRRRWVVGAAAAAAAAAAIVIPLSLGGADRPSKRGRAERGDRDLARFGACGGEGSAAVAVDGDGERARSRSARNPDEPVGGRAAVRRDARREAHDRGNRHGARAQHDDQAVPWHHRDYAGVGPRGPDRDEAGARDRLVAGRGPAPVHPALDGAPAAAPGGYCWPLPCTGPGGSKDEPARQEEEAPMRSTSGEAYSLSRQR